MLDSISAGTVQPCRWTATTTRGQSHRPPCRCGWSAPGFRLHRLFEGLERGTRHRQTLTEREVRQRMTGSSVREQAVEVDESWILRADEPRIEHLYLANGYMG